MKTKTLLFAFSFAAFGFVSCSKDDSSSAQTPPPAVPETYINATSKIAWHYFSLAQNKVIGTGDETPEQNTAWGARTDWDLAIRRYQVRTNSGAFTTVNAEGGVHIYKTAKVDGDVYVYDQKIPYSSVLSVPSGAQFVVDKSITVSGMGGETTTVQSEAEIIKFKKKWDDVNQKWVTDMPPVYLKAPLCIFRTADGKSHYKVEFTQYLDDAGVTGHVKFYSSLLE